METDILIVGAGPTGLMLANQLARHGVRTMIIDRHSGPAQQSRAMGVQARTLEIYAKLGIARQAIDSGHVTDGVNLWAEARHKARIPVREIGEGLGPYPFVLMLGQDLNERMLGDRLNQQGVDVQWNTELIALEQHTDRVVATLRRTDGSEHRIDVGWVAGCDGARSAVRTMCGIDFPGAPYEHVFFVADTIATGDMAPDELNVYLWKRGFHLFFPMRGEDRWRVIGILPTALRDKEHPTFDDVVPYLRREAGAGLSFQSCHWFSTYRISHRSASRFREGRCFLLGDAAHVHSPMGAQGMNTGLQDAYNLAWKLAMVVKGQSEPALLDTYEAERMQVAHALLRGTDKAFGWVVSDTALAALFRTRIMGNVAAFAMRSRRVRRLFFRLISQIGIRYRRSPLSEDLGTADRGAPKAGERFPWLRLKMSEEGPVENLFDRLDDTRFNLIVIGQPALPLPPLRSLATHVVPDCAENARELARARIAGSCFYLLRPDGHIGLAGMDLDTDEVTRYLADRQLRIAQEWDSPFVFDPERQADAFHALANTAAPSALRSRASEAAPPRESAA